MMKRIFQSVIVRRLLYLLGAFILFVLFLNNIILPWYVSSPQTTVPDVVGMPDTAAINILTGMGFEPMIIDTSYGIKYPKGYIFLQKPKPGEIVKEGRNIYLFVSGGEQIVLVPQLIGKSVLDAKFALERIGLKLGRVEQVPSNKPEDMIFDQQYAEGTPLKKGETVDVTVSAGRGGGTITVPDLIGLSLTQAESILMDSSLTVGKINYQRSATLLPNTVLDQYPSSGNKLNPGESVDLFVTKSNEPQTIEEDTEEQ